MAGLKVSFYGSSLVSAYWNGAATYYRGIIRALAARGHEVTFFEPDAWDRQKHRDIADPDWARVVVYANDEASARRALEQGRDADVIVKASGVGVFDSLLEAGVLEIRRPETTVIFWDVDAPATLASMRDDPRDTLRPLIKEFDYVLTYGGGNPVIDAYKAIGARDYPVVQNGILLIACLVILVNFTVDILYGLANPRIRHQK